MYGVRTVVSPPRCHRARGSRVWPSAACPQGDSTYRTGPQRVFGSSVDRSVKTSKASPGPIYTGDANACARQKISDKRSAPVIAFPRAQRFQQQGDRRDDYARSTPGPGDYLI